jgi:hypothetical protein
MAIVTQFALDVSLDALQKVTDSTMQKAAFALGNEFSLKFLIHLDESFFSRLLKEVTDTKASKSLDDVIIIFSS